MRNDACQHESVALISNVLGRHFAAGRPHPSSETLASAFTLVELILVMAILGIVLSIAAPSLGGFVRGRTLDSEARQLLSLAHAGQSRAVSEGAPMVLWVDVEQRTYGLEEEPGWVDKDPKAETFTLDENLKMEVVNAAPVKKASTRNLPSAGAAPRANPRGLPEIRFLPDGTLGETSPQGLRLFDRDNNSLWLAQARNRLTYEIRNQLE